jgi:ribosomal protein S18 acetylase RimI-like enzyme
MLEIRIASTPADIEIARTLFREYQASLGVDLGFQDFEAELRTLPGDYVSPGGLLLLAFDGDDAAGCVAMRPLGDATCEMKRLYIRPRFRGSGAGLQLARHIIESARAAGYRRMLLDTLPSMTGAQRMYERLGFRDVPPYRHNPIEGTRYLGLEL